MVSSDNSFADYDNVPHNYFDPFCDSYVDKYPHPYFCSPGTMPCDKQTKINNCQAFFPRAACLADNSCLITPSPTSLPSPTNSASTSPSPTPSPTTGTKRGDFNNDGKINVLDLSTLLTQWGRTGTNSADLNQDGKVNVLDLSVLLTQFGK